MAQLFRSRPSRAFATLVVLVIAGVAIFKFQSIRKGKQASAGKATMLSAVPVKPPAVEITKPPTALQPASQQKSTPAPTPPASTPPAPTPPALTPPVTPAPTPGPAAFKTDPPANIPPSADLFDSATKLTAAGKLVEARKVLNDAVLAGSLSTADTDTAMKQISALNQTLVFSDRRFKDDPRGGNYAVVHGDSLTKIAAKYSVPVELLKQINKFTSDKDLKADEPIKVIQGPVCAVVTKSKFRIDLYLGSPGGPDSVYLTSYPVGLGADNSTPTGTWQIKNRLKSPSYNSPPGRPKQHFDAGDPKSPIGAYWMGLEGVDGQAVGKQSYGIHGTIDPDSIGKQSSEGCIRLRNDDVEKIYDLMVMHKSVVVVKD